MDKIQRTLWYLDDQQQQEAFSTQKNQMALQEEDHFNIQGEIEKNNNKINEIAQLLASL